MRTNSQGQFVSKKKPRTIKIYTLNAAFNAFGGFDEPLNTVLEDYFEETSVCTVVADRVYQAVHKYVSVLETNPARKITGEQRKDRQELIESLKEIRERLHPLYIPLPLLNRARSAYGPHRLGKPTLDLEIGDILQRLQHLQKLFEATEIPVPTSTNPGKHEQAQLIEDLGEIFDEFTKNDQSYIRTPKKEVEQQRQSFTTEVCTTFSLAIKTPRHR